MQHQTPIAMLQHWEKETPREVYLRQPVDGLWQTWTWQQTAMEVRQLASAIRSLGLPAGSHIALLSKNSAHWMITDLAIMMAGHVSIPLYPNLQAATVREILEHSEAKLLFVGKLDNWRAARPGVPEGLRCIAMPFTDNEGCESWPDFTKPHPPLEGFIDRPAEELCSIIYTSGTTGSPKGAMFTFNAFGFVAENAIRYLGFVHTDRFFSYLPLSHIAERMLVQMVGLYVGGTVSFAESLLSFAQNLAEAKPTIFLGVHRIWSKFQQGILKKLPQDKLDRLLRIPVVSGIVKKKIRKGLGLQEGRMILTGAAPTPPELIRWYHRLGIRIREAYAMTENCCYSHVTPAGNIRIGFVGQALPQCDVRLGENQEIQVRHAALMKGYYKEPGKTAEAFTEDGFLRTGDEGFIDEEGFLKITGRIKDLFKTSKGKYVAPSPIEMAFSADPHIEQVCLVGSGLPQPMALLTLSDEGEKRFATDLETYLKGVLSAINSTLDAHEKVAKIVVIQEPWLVENNLLTPSLKIRRNELEKRYAPFYTEWYNAPEAVTIAGK